MMQRTPGRLSGYTEVMLPRGPIPGPLRCLRTAMKRGGLFALIFLLPLSQTAGGLRPTAHSSPRISPRVKPVPSVRPSTLPAEPPSVWSRNLPPPPHSIRLIWSGLDEDRYEVQGARDPRFKEGLQKKVFDYGKLVPLEELPFYARIRAIRDDDPASDWVPLRTRPWGPPSIKGPIRVKLAEKKRVAAVWFPPPSKPKNLKLTYRVRIFDPRGIALIDSMIKNERILLPPLPGGAFELQLETLGDESAGNLHIEGESAVAVTILVE